MYCMGCVVLSYIVEIATTSRNRLVDAIDHVSGNGKTVFDVDVYTAEADDDTGEPEEERSAGAVRAFDDATGAVENAGAFFCKRNVSDAHRFPAGELNSNEREGN